MIEKLACQLGRNDEVPNILLAEELAANEDEKGIEEIVMGLKGKDKAIANDCIKVLYEIGERKPELISAYAIIFIELVLSKNNRLAWGSMTALAQIAQLQADIIFQHIEVVKAAYQSGSVITRDQSITVFAKLCKANKHYENELFPFLLQHLKECRPKEVPQHAQRMSICLDDSNIKGFEETLMERKDSLTTAQIKRIKSLMKKLKEKI